MIGNIGAFCDFKDLGIEDYIVNLNWNIKGKVFPLNKNTTGDLVNFDDIDHSHPNCAPDKKLYKNFLVESDDTPRVSEVDTTTFLSEPKSLIKEFGYVQILEKQLNERLVRSEKTINQLSNFTNYSRYSDTNTTTVQNTNLISAQSSIINSNYNPSFNVLNFENKINSVIKEIKKYGDVLSYKNTQFSLSTNNYNSNSYFSDATIISKYNNIRNFNQTNELNKVQNSYIKNQTLFSNNIENKALNYHSTIASNKSYSGSYFSQYFSENNENKFTDYSYRTNSINNTLNIDSSASSYLVEKILNQSTNYKTSSYFSRYSSQNQQFSFSSFIDNKNINIDSKNLDASYITQSKSVEHNNETKNSYFTRYYDQTNISNIKNYSNSSKDNIYNVIDSSNIFNKLSNNEYQNNALYNRSSSSYFTHNNLNSKIDSVANSYFTRYSAQTNVSNSINNLKLSIENKDMKSGGKLDGDIMNNVGDRRTKVGEAKYVTNNSYFERKDVNNIFNVLNDSREFQKTQITNLSEKIVSFNAAHNTNIVSSNTVVKNEITNIKNEIKHELKQEIVKELNREPQDVKVSTEEIVEEKDLKQLPITEMPVNVENVSIEKVTKNNFENVIKNKINQSNLYSEETIIELEQNLNKITNITNNHATKTEIRELKKEITEKQENQREDLKKEIQENKNFLEKFLSS